MGAVNASRTAAMENPTPCIHLWGDTHGTEAESLGRHTLAKSRDYDSMASDLPNRKTDFILNNIMVVYLISICFTLFTHIQANIFTYCSRLLFA